jgi:two-component system response regulator AtoC
VTKRILIVDDDTSLLHMLEDGIEVFCAGWQVECVPDGRTALKQLATQTFDLIMTDYDMPGMNGLELALVMRQTLPHTPIVLMTASGDGEGLRDEISALELYSYLQKPFSLRQIQDLLEGTKEGA